MYFEFEVTNSNDVGPPIGDSKSPSGEDGKSTPNRSSSSPTSPLAHRKNLFGNSLSSSHSSTSSLSNNSSTPIKSPFISSLLMPSSSPISPQRYRRYSIHSSPNPVTLDTLHDNGNVTFCDLALITKKKLLQLNNSFVKVLDEEDNEPDVKLNLSFCKPSNKDLRREVLLASMQRSLSVSSDDLSFSPGSSKISEFSESELFKLTDKSDIDTDDLPMEIVANSAKMLLANSKNFLPCSISADEIMGECFLPPFDMKKSHISRVRARRTLGSYTPIENQINCMNSQTTFTSTTSMAGASKGGLSGRGYIKKLNVNAFSLLGNGSSPGNPGHYYSSSSASSPKLNCMTMTSSLNSPIKRLHSSSPSKYVSSPYHTISNSISPKDLNLIFANASNQLSPDWDMAFKRLKVMHGNVDPSGEVGTPNEGSANEQEKHISLMNANNLQLQPFGPTSGQPEHELNELAQDFHRLKTPFI